MEQFPEWVPEDVIRYYRQQIEKDYADDYTELENASIRRLMNSLDMKKTWQAIESRSYERDLWPWVFAQLVRHAVRSAEQLDKYPPQEQVDTFIKITSDAKALAQSFEDALGNWADEVILHYFGVRPDKVTKEVADKMEKFTQMVTDHRKILTDLTHKPGSETAKRTFLIRCLSESIREHYAAPLHEHVAVTVSVILDEDIDVDLVTKIVNYRRVL